MSLDPKASPKLYPEKSQSVNHSIHVQIDIDIYTYVYSVRTFPYRTPITPLKALHGSRNHGARSSARLSVFFFWLLIGKGGMENWVANYSECESLGFGLRISGQPMQRWTSLVEAVEPRNM